MTTKSATARKDAAQSRSAEVRARLPHPVVDTDGHILEVTEVVLDYLREAGGSKIVEQFKKVPPIHVFHVNNGMMLSPGASPLLNLEQRREIWQDRPHFWTLPTGSTLDRATGMLPALMSKRLDDMGIDLTVLFPTLLQCLSCSDDELRQVACRAFNTYYADLLRPYADRMIPVAMIPMQTPAEAISELEHAVKTLGYRAVVLQAWGSRPIPEMVRKYPDMAHLFTRPDLFALDSAYDYDPVWAKCVELGVAPTFHGVGVGPGVNRRGSISNHMFNNSVVGGFAASAQDIAGALLLGGVTHRFPTLNFGFMEGGSAWAVGLLGRIAERWEKRNGRAMREMLDPSVLNRKQLAELLRTHGDAHTLRAADRFLNSLEHDFPEPESIDEFAALRIDSEEELNDRFVDRFYFGCEGDDATTAIAFRGELMPLGQPLRPVIGSDISHWDVPDMTVVIAEAYEAVERGNMTESHFRDFVFTNPVRLHAGMNPAFFRGTRVESEVQQLLAKEVAKN